MRPLFTTQTRRERTLCSASFLASALILIGFFGPWVAHRTAALTVTGYELSEFAKFFPQVQGGVVPVKRALFITPLFAATISLALISHRSKGRPLFRFGGTALAALLDLAALPPYQSLLEPAYRPQLILVGIGLLLTLSTPLTGRLSEHVRSLLFLVIALVGAIPALWQYVLLRPLIGGLYEARVLPGWGIIVCTVGFLLLSLASLRDILRA